MKKVNLVLLALIASLGVASCEAISGVVGDSDIFCHCDVIVEESTCLEASGPDIYTVQVAASCEGVIHGTCEATQVGEYHDSPCPGADRYAVCIDDTGGYRVSKYFYTSGPEPYGADRHQEIEDECSTGAVTYY